jgi:hypothetical protein
MIEFLLDQTTNVMLDFEEILFQRLSTEVIEHDVITEYLSECDIAKCTDVVKLAYSLRYGQTTLGKKHSLQTLGYLHFVAFKLPKLFAEIFFDFMYVYMATMRVYCDKDAKVVGYDEETNVKEYGKSKVSLDYKYYTMKTPRKNTIKLSNCRGLGLACLNLLCLYVIKDTDRNFTIFKDSFITSAEANFFAGLGDDITARLISGRSVLTGNAERSYTEYIIFNSNRTYSIGDKSICREVYEEEFLYRKAHGVSYNEGLSDTKYKDVSVHYFTVDSIISASSVIYTVCAKNESSYRENIRLLKCAKSELEKSKRHVSSLEVELKKADSEKEKLVEKLTKEYDEKLKELNYQLEQKSQINAQLSEKITSLNSKLSSFFCEEDLDTNDDEVVIEVS